MATLIYIATKNVQRILFFSSLSSVDIILPLICKYFSSVGCLFTRLIISLAAPDLFTLL